MRSVGMQPIDGRRICSLMVQELITFSVDLVLGGHDQILTSWQDREAALDPDCGFWLDTVGVVELVLAQECVDHCNIAGDESIVRGLIAFAPAISRDEF